MTETDTNVGGAVAQVEASQVIQQGPVVDPALANEPHPATLQPQTIVEPPVAQALQPSSGSAQVQQGSAGSGSTQGSGPQPQPNPATTVKAPPTPAPATPGVSAPVAQITQPEHASTVIKSKVTELHSLIHNAAGYATLPIHAIEAVMADMSYLFGIVRSKL